jgi:hypothetical protein
MVNSGFLQQPRLFLWLFVYGWSADGRERAPGIGNFYQDNTEGGSK